MQGIGGPRYDSSININNHQPEVATVSNKDQKVSRVAKDAFEIGSVLKGDKSQGIYHQFKIRDASGTKELTVSAIYDKTLRGAVKEGTVKEEGKVTINQQTKIKQINGKTFIQTFDAKGNKIWVNLDQLQDKLGAANKKLFSEKDVLKLVDRYNEQFSPESIEKRIQTKVDNIDKNLHFNIEKQTYFTKDGYNTGITYESLRNMVKQQVLSSSIFVKATSQYQLKITSGSNPAEPSLGKGHDVKIAKLIVTENGKGEVTGLHMKRYEGAKKDKLGAGSFGKAYRVFDLMKPKAPAEAMKLMATKGKSDDQINSAIIDFNNEYRNLKLLQEGKPATVDGIPDKPGHQVDFVTKDGKIRRGFVTTLYDGDLSKNKDLESFTPKQRMDGIRQLLSGAQWAHSSGITNGDIKPENIFMKQVNNEWKLFLCDWGGSKTTEDVKGNWQESWSQTWGVHSPVWLSPNDLTQGQKLMQSGKMDEFLQLKEQRDLFALGGTMFVMLTGCETDQVYSGNSLRKEVDDLGSKITSTASEIEEKFKGAGKDGIRKIAKELGNSSDPIVKAISTRLERLVSENKGLSPELLSTVTREVFGQEMPKILQKLIVNDYQEGCAYREKALTDKGYPPEVATLLNGLLHPDSGQRMNMGQALELLSKIGLK